MSLKYEPSAVPSGVLLVRGDHQRQRPRWGVHSAEQRRNPLHNPPHGAEHDGGSLDHRRGTSLSLYYSQA